MQLGGLGSLSGAKLVIYSSTVVQKRVEEQLHAVERELSRVLGEKQEIEDETQHIRRVSDVIRTC